MAESVTFNNATYIIPDVGESNWGQNLTNYFVAIPSGCYQLSGGTAPLTADLSFGTNFGLFAKYLTSVTANPAGAGVVRLANADTIDWRNAANSANLALSVDSSNNLLWNGDIVATASASPVLSIAGTANQITASAATGNVTLSVPSTFIAPGSIAATTTLAGTKVTLSATTNQLVLGTTNTVTLSSTAPASSRTYTIPDAGGAANVVLDAGNYTIAGTWSFSNSITLASSKALILTDNSTNTVTIQATNSTTSWTMKLPTTHGSSNQFLQTDGSGNTTWAAGGAGTISSGTTGQLGVYTGTTTISSTGNTLGQFKVVVADVNGYPVSLASAGSSGVPLVSGGASANPSFTQLSLTAGVTGTLPVGNGGTGKTALSSFVPTIQSFLSGTGSYTTPAGVTWIRVRLVGAGGGGAGSGQTGSTGNGGAGGNGGNTTFGTTLLAANGGSGGAANGAGPTGGAGGTASLGSGPIGMAIAGGIGGGPGAGATAGINYVGGMGAASALGGAGGAGSVGAGAAGATNTGGGGGGGGNAAGGIFGGSGGGSGGFVDAIITAPLSTYSYAVGAAGGAGTAGGSGFVGGAGGSGLIIVEEHYI